MYDSLPYSADCQGGVLSGEGLGRPCPALPRPTLARRLGLVALALLLALTFELGPVAKARHAEAFAPVAAAALPYAGYALLAIAGIMGVNVAAENAGSIGAAFDAFITDYDTMMNSAASCAADFIKGAAADGVDILQTNVEVTQQSVDDLVSWLEECSRSGVIDCNDLSAVTPSGELSSSYFIIQAFLNELTYVRRLFGTVSVTAPASASNYFRDTRLGYGVSAISWGHAPHYVKSMTASANVWSSAQASARTHGATTSAQEFNFRIADPAYFNRQDVRLFYPLLSTETDWSVDYCDCSVWYVPICVCYDDGASNTFTPPGVVYLMKVSVAALLGDDYSPAGESALNSIESGSYIERARALYSNCPIGLQSYRCSNGVYDRLRMRAVGVDGVVGYADVGNWRMMLVSDYLAAISSGKPFSGKMGTAPYAWEDSAMGIYASGVLSEPRFGYSYCFNPFLNYSGFPTLSSGLGFSFTKWDAFSLPDVPLTDNPDVLPYKEKYSDVTRDVINASAGAAVLGGGIVIDGGYIKDRGKVGFPPIPTDNPASSSPLSGAGSWGDALSGTNSGVAEKVWGNSIPTDRTVTSSKAHVGEGENTQVVTGTAVDVLNPSTSIPTVITPSPAPSGGLGTALTDLGDSVSGKFPFCVPFWISDGLSVLVATPEAPQFDWVFDTPVGIYTYRVDLSPYSSVAGIFRTMFNILFIFALVRFVKLVWDTRKGATDD